MNVRWKKLLVRSILWIAVELWLNFLGIDDVADYSEFMALLNQDIILSKAVTMQMKSE